MCRHANMLNLALKKSDESKFSGYKHGAVLVKGGRVIATGTNHSKRGIIFDEVYGFKMFHAEIDVLSKFEPEEVEGAILYVAGKTEKGHILNSKPCECCQHVIKKYPLKAVYYCDAGEVRRLGDEAV